MRHPRQWRNALRVVVLVGIAFSANRRAAAQPEAQRERPDVLLPVEGKSAAVNAQLWAYILRTDQKTGKLEIKVRSAGQEEKPQFVPVDELPKLKQITLLHTVRPQRMAVVVASFPYRSQVQEFRRKLRLPSDRDVLDETSSDKTAAFRFLGVDVERRLVGPAGMPLRREEGDNGYVPLDIASEYKQLLVITNLQKHDDDPYLGAVLIPGLVMPWLVFARGEEEYPKIERELATIRKSLEALKDRKELPEHCLIRVFDATVRPGERYQYRLRVRMANPNYKRKDVANPRDAEDADLKSADGRKWFEVPEIVTVPTGIRYYAVDQKALEKTRYQGAYKDARVGYDQTVLQIHKYLDYINPTPWQRVAAADWSVAERVVVSRGEVIDRPVRVEVPVLVEEEERWKLASTKNEKGRAPGVDVLFDGVPGRAAVLVDFDSGTPQRYKRAGGPEIRDSSAQEILILAADGHLRAHNSAVDAADQHRREGLKTWRDRIDEVRKLADPRPGRDPFGKP
jgi:hypothetical protein